MIEHLADVVVFAQDSGTGRAPGGTDSSEGDSSLVFVMVATVISLVVVTGALLIARARGTDQSQSPRRAHHTEVSKERGASGRPLHIDPDPDRLAGGRSRMIDPLRPEPR